MITSAILAFCSRTEEYQGNLDRDGRSEGHQYCC